MDLIEISKGLPSALRGRVLSGGSLAQNPYINNRVTANVLGQRAGVRVGNARNIEATAKKIRPVRTPYGTRSTTASGDMRAIAGKEREFAGEDIKLGRRMRDASRTEL